MAAVAMHSNHAFPWAVFTEEQGKVFFWVFFAAAGGFKRAY
jgi:hypothetical protein